MYRAYEDPYKLEQILNDLKLELENAKDEDEQFEISLEINAIKDRINFAWQDDEYDEREATY